jgi:hypothetical protein
MRAGGRQQREGRESYSSMRGQRRAGMQRQGCGPPANHICQSRRAWWGTRKGGRRLTSPGLYLRAGAAAAAACQQSGTLPRSKPLSRKLLPATSRHAPPTATQHAPEPDRPPLLAVVGSKDLQLGPRGGQALAVVAHARHAPEQPVAAGQVPGLRGAGGLVHVRPGPAAGSGGKGAGGRSGRHLGPRGAPSARPLQHSSTAAPRSTGMEQVPPPVTPGKAAASRGRRAPDLPGHALWAEAGDGGRARQVGAQHGRPCGAGPQQQHHYLHRVACQLLHSGQAACALLGRRGPEEARQDEEKVEQHCCCQHRAPGDQGSRQQPIHPLLQLLGRHGQLQVRAACLRLEAEHGRRGPDHRGQAQQQGERGEAVCQAVGAADEAVQPLQQASPGARRRLGIAAAAAAAVCRVSAAAVCCRLGRRWRRCRGGR